MQNVNIGSDPFFERLRRIAFALIGVGALGLGATFALDGQQRAVGDYLVGFWYFAGISVTMLFFTILQFLTRAGWSVGIRRIAENFTGMVPFLLIFLVPIVLNMMGHHSIYEWTLPEAANDELLKLKEPYLNIPFFAGRLFFYCLLWFGMYKVIVGNSVKQDTATDIKPTLSNFKHSAVWMIAYALTITFASFDLLMSLEPHWFSTIWGVYAFAGHFVAANAVIALMVVGLRNAGLLKGYLRDEHYHDLGKLMFAFSVFWAYIGFSQYFIIWYTNLPEETVYYTTRMNDTPWGIFGYLLMILRFVLPFFLLLRLDVKKKKFMLVLSAAVILVGHFIDIVWIVMPAVGKVMAHHAEGGHGYPFLFSWQEFTGLIFFAGIFLFFATNLFKKNNAVPVNDPLLKESFEYIS
ncbi:MAG: hypothetical protein J5I53_07315 [Bradyrhizobiaceae bacterium]|nr:hypothetical protein [Bradyrhizobiaceae bacterium]